MGEIKQFSDYRNTHDDKQREQEVPLEPMPVCKDMDRATTMIMGLQALADTVLDVLDDFDPAVVTSFLMILGYKYQAKHPEMDLTQVYGVQHI